MMKKKIYEGKLVGDFTIFKALRPLVFGRARVFDRKYSHYIIEYSDTCLRFGLNFKPLR